MKKIMMIFIFAVGILFNCNIACAKQGDSVKHAIILSKNAISEKNLSVKTKNYLLKKNEVLWLKFSTSNRGEYDILSYGSIDTIGVIYRKNIVGKLEKIGSNDNGGSNKNFFLKAGLKGNTTYYVGVMAKAKGNIKVGVQVHQDRYSGSTFLKQGGSWNPGSKTMQPYFNQSVHKITWLTPGDAAIYSTGLAKSKYLRMLNTGVKLSVILVTAGVNKKSAVGKYIIKMGEKDVTKIITTIAGSYGGISLVPDIIDISQKAVEKYTANYKYGLKVTTMMSANYGTVNCYDQWNLKNNSVKGPTFCRGSFKTGDLKVGGW